MESSAARARRRGLHRHQPSPRVIDLTSASRETSLDALVAGIGVKRQCPQAPMERKPSVASDLLSVRDEHLGVYALGPALRG